MSALSMDDIRRLGEDKIREHALDLYGWRFVWDRKATARAGQCRYGRKEIGLSWKIFSIEANRQDALNTILHEIAHALTPGEHHGPKWKRVARDIGCNAARCHTLETPPKPPAKYAGTCGCGAIHSMRRMPTRQYRCRVCRKIVEWATR